MDAGTAEAGSAPERRPTWNPDLLRTHFKAASGDAIGVRWQHRLAIPKGHVFPPCNRLRRLSRSPLSELIAWNTASSVALLLREEVWALLQGQGTNMIARATRAKSPREIPFPAVILVLSVRRFMGSCSQSFLHGIFPSASSSGKSSAHPGTSENRKTALQSRRGLVR